MQTQSAKEKILGKIKKALEANKLPMPFPEADKESSFFVQNNTSKEEKFAEEFSKLGGRFIYCANETEMATHLIELMDAKKIDKLYCKDHFLVSLLSENGIGNIETTAMNGIEVGVSLCECLVARTGSLILSSAMQHGRSLPVYAPIHIAIAFANQVVWNIEDSLNAMKEKYPEKLPSMISLTTGPSRTADIEKTLVVGVHGPKEVYVFFIDKNWKQ